MSANLAITPPTTHSASWKDGKRYGWLLSPGLPAFALLTALSVTLGAPTLLLWALPVLFYVGIPILDWLLGDDRVNAPTSAVAGLEADAYYRRIVYLYIPMQYALTLVGAWLFVNTALNPVELLGLIISVGTINGIGINTAHELGHKTNALERWLAKVTLAPVAYGHFFVEHNKGHHKNVATPIDPASSRMGEGFWQFLPRTVVGSLKSAWRIEAERLQRLDQSVWSLKNENLHAWAMTVVLFAAIAMWLGPWVLVFLVLQAMYGASLLEVVNYVEHYGLLRQKLPNGRYERCQPTHSWNSNHIITNLLLYQLQRHSDHHANPTRRYQALRHFDDSPQLPSGYAAMILIAYFPPIWFRLMDPKVVAHHGGDLRLAHLHAPARARLLQRYPPPEQALVSEGQGGIHQAHLVSASRYQCPNCGYVYDEELGCPNEGYVAGTLWAALPNHWQCPDCAVREKPDFMPIVNSLV